MTKYLPFAFILAGLAALVLIAGCRTAAPPESEHRMHETASPQAAPAPMTDHMATTDSPVVTIGKDEASCPVLGTVMSKSMMIPVQHNGKTYYLCCRDCIAKFKADPEKYINHPAPPTHEMKHD